MTERNINQLSDLRAVYAKDLPISDTVSEISPRLRRAGLVLTFVGGIGLLAAACGGGKGERPQVQSPDLVPTRPAPTRTAEPTIAPTATAAPTEAPKPTATPEVAPKETRIENVKKILSAEFVPVTFEELKSAVDAVYVKYPDLKIVSIREFTKETIETVVLPLCKIGGRLGPAEKPSGCAAFVRIFAEGYADLGHPELLDVATTGFNFGRTEFKEGTDDRETFLRNTEQTLQRRIIKNSTK